jgi:hypothetical protein
MGLIDGIDARIKVVQPFTQLANGCLASNESKKVCHSAEAQDGRAQTAVADAGAPTQGSA